MEIIEKILKERSADFLGALTGEAGLTAGQAERFLPEAGSAVGQSMTAKVSELDLADLTSGANVRAVTNGIDIAGLASRVGVSAEQGSKGLAALLPMILSLVGDKAGDAGGLLGLLGGGEGLGDTLGTLKGLGGRLFK